MVFLPPDSSTILAKNSCDQIGNDSALNSTERKYLSTAAPQDRGQYLTLSGDGGVRGGGGNTHLTEPEYSYQQSFQSMILVQVNPGETFTIQAEEGTQCIQGPAQVPMVSPNGAIPPIHVPHGYISHVIEENGIRRVVVIPEMQPTHFPSAPVAPPIVSQPPHGMHHHYSMQPGPPINYMQQMNVMSLNHQTQMFPASDPLSMLHPQQCYIQPDGSVGTDLNISHNLPNLPQHPYKFHLHTADMEFPSMTSRDAKVRERLQKKLHEKQHPPPDMKKNHSPNSVASISPRSVSTYGPTPSPNSSPDSSPRIIGSAVPLLPNFPNGYPNPRKMHSYQMHANLLNSPQQYQQHYPSPTHSPHNYNMPGNNGFRNSQNIQQISPKASTSDEMSSESSSSGGGSPQRMLSGTHRNLAISQEITHQYQTNIHRQQDLLFHSSVPQEPFPTGDGKWDLKEYLSAIIKPEVCDVGPRHAILKWSLRYSLPEDSDTHLRNKTIFYEIFLTDKGKDSNKFKLVRRDCSTYFEIKDLKPGIEYHTKVLAELNSIKGNHSAATKFRTQCCPPDTPGAPELYNRSKNSLNLRWAAPNDNGEKIIEYHLEWDEGKKGSGFRSLYSENQKQYKVTKLQPSHDYTFRLNSDNRVGASPWSPEVTYSTSGTAPATPDPPHLSKALVRSLVLTWTRMPAGGNDVVSGYATRFILEKDDGKGYGFRVVYDGADLRAHVKSLNKCFLYQFRLRAYNNEGKSGFSDIAPFYTLPDKPNPPGKVTLKGKAHPTWFKVAWEPPEETGGAEITKYVLECSNERGQQMEIIYTGPEREFYLGNVQPGITCRLRVSCMSNGGSSMPSEITLITPPPVMPGQCAPPRAATKARPNFISLRWDPPNYDGGSVIVQYEVAMNVDSCDETSDTASTISTKEIYQGSALSCSVGSLRPGTSYRFMVRAANKVGSGSWSDPVDIETSAGPPEKPDVPVADHITSDSVLLTWQTPHDNGSEVTGYSIEWGSVDSPMSLQQLNSCLSHNFQHLCPNTVYYFRVQANNLTGKSPFSDVASVKTTPSCPDRVRKVWQGDIPSTIDYELEDGEAGDEEEVDEDLFPRPATSAMVQWEVPATNGAGITNYILEVTPSKSKNQNKKKMQSFVEDDLMLHVVEESVNFFLLQNLQPDSEYRIRVKAVNEIGSGNFSSPVTIETQPLPPDPPVLECSCSCNALKLKWGDADSFNNIYRLQMKEKHGRFLTIYNGSGRSYKVNRLSERTTNHFRINARNHAGEGPFSIVYTFTTTTAPPPVLKTLPLVTVNHDNFADITWDNIDSIKGDPVSYVINIEDCEEGSGKENITVEHPTYRFGPLTPGNRYKLQVAIVRHLFSARHASNKQDVATQLEVGDSLNSTLNSSEHKTHDDSSDIPMQDDIIGQFTSWVTFQLPAVNAIDKDTVTGTSGRSETLQSQLQTVSSLRMKFLGDISDEKKAGLLLGGFFVGAILLALFVQLYV